MKEMRRDSGFAMPLFVASAVLALGLLLGFAGFARVFTCPACEWEFGYMWTHQPAVTHTGPCSRCDGTDRVTLFNKWFKEREPIYR